ncbi:related to multidrug resistance protein [Ramularia collo-cygni]|uniref:Related to multidrug resistance protein n=1 Tax=Ramularia collo-cygni TaxID=112498 RepID=A0A2D3UTN9_9PEZI|nr:related to multidrug resistance protein [Ramularia collo-cygni]CZT14156.1 related to multidrug resistance protein [Ramularia collo-cygni]
MANVSETSPLLRAHNAESRNFDDASTKNVVEFNPHGDAEDPKQWTNTYKYSAVFLLALTAFTVTFTCIAVVPVANHIVVDLEGHKDRKASVLLVTIWELGEAAGPLFIAPLSEVIGRYPVMNACNIVFIAATLLASFAPSATVLISARFLTGLAVASNVLNPSIVGDMFVAEQRGTAMSFIMLAPLIGGAVGPAISGAVAETLGWREMLWICAGLATICEVAFLAFFRETFKVPILNRRAAKLRKESGDKTYRTVFEIENAQKTGNHLWEQVLRPFVVMAGSGILQALSLIEAVAYTYFYVMSTTLPSILEDLYGLSAAATGAAFISFSAGSIISVALCNRLLDRIFIHLRDSNKGAEQPEYRLPLAIAGNILLPLTVVLYGWAAECHLPIAWVLVSLAALGAGLMLATLPLMSYVVDAFGMYSASAMTAVIVTRCLMGTFLPLATEPLIEKFGYGWAFTFLGVVTLGLAPIPIVIMRYGHKWRQRSSYTKDE